ncbi:MAG TPA: ATP-binding protein [Blastocatellia bacterium]|nr:ATP-binding protein [Blastocatellia bacterium]
MKKIGSFKLIIFFTALTVVLTWLVIFGYESYLRGPFYSWVEARYPGDKPLQETIEQRVEHFWISTMVDVIVVTLLLGLVNRQQRKVRESEKRYRALFEHAGDGIGVVTALDHLLVDANKKFGDILDLNHQAIVGKHISEIIDVVGDGPEHRLLSKLCDKGADEAGEWSDEEELDIRTGAGSQVTVAASCSKLSTGKQRFFILIIRDVTERKRLHRERQEIERQLFQQSKLASLGELSAGVAHEINNPLNCIVNFAQLLRDDGVARNEMERRMVDGIIEEGDRIASIVRNLLTFARQDSNKPTAVSVIRVIGDSVSLFGSQLERDGITLELESDPEIYPVRADATRLRQVVVNMISNAHYALKGKAPGERLFRITARNAGRAGERVVRMEFYDNGPGVPSKNVDKIFDPFFTTRRDSGGTGLGLSLSFGIIRDYGGQIWVESEEGRYTRFIVELPAEVSREAEYAESLAGGRRAEHTLDDGGAA